MTLDTKRPNQLLRYARQEQGWSQQRLAAQIGTTEDVVSRWERGTRIPSPFYREKLCQLFQKNALELGFINASMNSGYHLPVLNVVEQGRRSVMVLLEHFVFGELQTTWIVLDGGDESSEYTRKYIVSHFEPESLTLPPELEERRQQVARQQIRKRSLGLPFHWNGQRYCLKRFVISREGPEEHLALDLWFGPSDYYTFLATNMALDDPSLRARYLERADWSQPVPSFSNSFGLYLAVLTADRQILLTSRGSVVGSRPGEYNISVCEGLGAIDAQTSLNQAPDLFSCAQRGLSEELGLKVTDDFAPEDIHLLSFGIDTWYSQWGLLGLVHVQKSAQQILHYRNAGVKDRLENAQLHQIPFDPESVVAFIFAHQPWAPGGLACLYHVLVHEFGRAQVAQVVARYTTSSVE